MKLAELAARSGPPLPSGAPDPEIHGLSADSRSLRTGYLFAALPGVRQDGMAFLEEAVGRGAVAALVPPAAEARARTLGIAVVADALPRRRLARMAAVFHGSQPATVVAVSGTNGKTSTAHFLAGLWRHAGLAAAAVGTLGVRTRDAPAAAPSVPPLTTMEPVALHARLTALAQTGVTHTVLEASSHGLDQYRLDGTRIAVAVLTAMGRDHLDYHRTEHAYRAAKRRLFAELLAPGGTAIVNRDTASHDIVSGADRADVTVLGYGRSPGADWRLRAARPAGRGQRLHLSTPDGERTVRFGPPGGFQADNALAALAAAVTTGVPLDAALAGLESLQAPVGRLERVAAPDGASIFVDYAHTPDALAAALDALRPHAEGGLHVVFGCGGDRDPGKRVLMGEVAAERADRVTVTDDNPRSEDPAAIRAAVRRGAPDSLEIGDRRSAIEHALSQLQAGDVLLIAGKGHETAQIVQGEARPFDDRALVRSLVAGAAG